MTYESYQELLAIAGEFGITVVEGRETDPYTVYHLNRWAGEAYSLVGVAALLHNLMRP